MTWTPKKIQVAGLGILVILLILVGTGFYSLHEGLSVVDAFYLAIATLSTVGYGDVHPITDVGKIFTAFYILFGVAVFLYAVSVIAAAYVKREQKAIIDIVERRLHAKLEEHLGTAKNKNAKKMQ